MRKKLRISDLLGVSVIVLLFALVGCQSLLNKIIPCDVPSEVINYTSTEPNEVWPTLDSAYKLKRKAIARHRARQLYYDRAAQDDKFAYQDAVDIVDLQIKESEQFKQQLIEGTPASYGIGLSAVLSSIGGLYIGRNFLKRPGDKSPEEVEKEKLEAKIQS